MKRVIEDNEACGFDALLGKCIQVWCMNYIYTGTLIGSNADHIELDNASVVYETGELTEPGWKDAQPTNGKWMVRLASVESYGEVLDA